MKNFRNTAVALLNDRLGQTTVEWSLLLAAFGIPMILVFRLMLATMTAYYQMLTCLISLPYP